MYPPWLWALMQAKQLTPQDMDRAGFRWTGSALCWFHPEGLKFRRGDERWTEPDATFTKLRILRRTGLGPASGIIIAEGETDAAALLRACGAWDIGVLPAGAKGPTPEMLAQCNGYDKVLVGTDADEAGDKAAAEWHAALPGSLRFRPEGSNDWGEFIAINGDEFAVMMYVEQPPKLVYSIREVLAADLGTGQDASWFADGLLPVGGLAALHATKKSLKSFILLEWCRALATGDTFAGEYEFVHSVEDGVRVLLYQLEIPPYYFQQRAAALVASCDPDLRDRLVDNMHVYEVGNKRLPKLRVGQGWVESVAAAAELVGARVVAFDPIQRMTGSASTDKANEMDPLLDGFAELQRAGLTVIYSHHNNKSERQSRDGNAMSGTQRFGADPDAICSVWRSSGMMPDDNSERIKVRNFSWELRNGAARSRSVTVRPSKINPEIPEVTFDVPQTAQDELEDML